MLDGLQDDIGSYEGFYSVAQQHVAVGLNVQDVRGFYDFCMFFKG